MRVRRRLFLYAVSVTNVVYFQVNVTRFGAKHLKFNSRYSNKNYRLKGLSRWHVFDQRVLLII